MKTEVYVTGGRFEVDKMSILKSGEENWDALLVSAHS